MSKESLRFGWAVAVLLCGLSWGGPAHAKAPSRISLGPHVGMNFDRTDAFLGIESRIDLAQLGTMAILQLNPSASYYFADDVDLLNFSLNLPFEFVIRDSVLRPLAGAGIGMYYLDYGPGTDTDFALNLLGGFAFDLRDVEPFVQLRAAIGDGSVAELMAGILFVL